jgi:hypothetical protein
LVATAATLIASVAVAGFRVFDGPSPIETLLLVITLQLAYVAGLLLAAVNRRSAGATRKRPRHRSN